MRVIFLLAPVFVSFFWAIALRGHKLKHSAPRLFLSKFMFLTGLIFFCHFLYFASYFDFYAYFSVLLQWLSLIIFPLYHIYFRLLTVDEKFSFRLHFRYLAIPSAVALIYAIGVLVTPTASYRAWLVNISDNQSSPYIEFLIKMRTVLHISYTLALGLSLIGNLRLIRKYGYKAEQFYSEIQDTSLKNARSINYVVIIMSISAIILSTIGRYTAIVKTDWFIYIGWAVFAILLFLLGESGNRQKLINPFIDPSNREEVADKFFELDSDEAKVLLKKITDEFTFNKPYLNSDLNLSDIAKKIGTNRTYISSVINQQCNQNFCTFVNRFRLEEVERIILVNQSYSNEEIAQNSGFGSVNSLKRAVQAKSGMSVSNYKKKVNNR
jgi:AraC-like DNA-binding protein